MNKAKIKEFVFVAAACAVGTALISPFLGKLNQWAQSKATKV